ncbi:MAG: pentapeptide repeat-containing protein [bacterium]
MKVVREQHKSWLKTRWGRNLINNIVYNLNKGKEISGLLKEVPQNENIPPREEFIDLRGIDFSHQNLRGPWTMHNGQRYRKGICLKKADFSYANLAWVILPRADLRGSMFIETDLSNAELIYSDFSYTDLSGANLKEAWLLDTKFYESKVSENQLKNRMNIKQMDFDYHAYEM